MSKPKHTVKRRRLDAEIEHLEQQIADTKQMIKHDPYPQDQPGLKAQLAGLKEMLADAERESNQEIIDHHQRLRDAKLPRGLKDRVAMTFGS